jgi:hypothetical protein
LLWVADDEATQPRLISLGGWRDALVNCQLDQHSTGQNAIEASAVEHELSRLVVKQEEQQVLCDQRHAIDATPVGSARIRVGAVSANKCRIGEG